MPTRPPTYQMHFFVLRLWQEALDAEKSEWRGEIKNTTSGEIRYFRDWHTLAHLLPSLIAEPAPPANDEADELFD